jgi:hypothetical protein
LNKENIIFVGDSYCATFLNTKEESLPSGQVGSHQPTYLNLVANNFDCDLYSFGYAGKSWWYSRCELINFLNNNSAWYQNNQAIIFCHTDCNRPNTTDPSIGTGLLSQDNQHTIQAQAYKLWELEIKDSAFQRWAQDQWFNEINQKFSHIKTIHFNVSFDSVESSQNLLPGSVFTTPLINISLGEFVGSDSEVLSKSTFMDQRPNHFNEKNNQAMANLIIDSLKNYSKGSRPVDLVKYGFDQPNPNAHRWPDPGWGTQ